tara:strand:+ start:616 stop:939 length:324 start_codon:yes stop_codon:yes gene_type:complete
MSREKRNAGPRVIRYEKRPPGRSAARNVWSAAYHLFGCPPSFLRVVPPQRWTVAEETGERILTKTTRWEIGDPNNDDNIIIINAPSKKAIEILTHCKSHEYVKRGII